MQNRKSRRIGKIPEILTVYWEGKLQLQERLRDIYDPELCSCRRGCKIPGTLSWDDLSNTQANWNQTLDTSN